ncbi:MAG TPA: YggT family protein [Thermomicrobiales bacterium]|nr:YggT family protein [Thermomicrobiales bacterium]
MNAREPYDQERIVRQIESHDLPTQSLPRTDVIRRESVPVADDAVYARDHLVREDVVVNQPVTHYDLAAESVSENVTIDHVLARRAALDRVSSVIWFVVGMLEVAIGLRVAFKLLEANTSSGFVTFIYDVTEPFVRPFQGIFTDPTSDGAVLDSAALMAMVIWAIVALGVVRLIWLLFDRSETGVRRSVRQSNRDLA